MSSETNVTVHVGTLAEVKVGRHQVLVVVIASTSFGWMVKSISSGREFQVAKIEKVFPSDDNEATDKSEATDYETTNSEQDSPIMENPAQNSETTTIYSAEHFRERGQFTSVIELTFAVVRS